MVAIAALIAFIPVGFVVPTLVLSGVAGLCVVGLVAMWDTLAYQGGVPSLTVHIMYPWLAPAATRVLPAATPSRTSS